MLENNPENFEKEQGDRMAITDIRAFHKTMMMERGSDKPVTLWVPGTRAEDRPGDTWEITYDKCSILSHCK